MTWDVVVAGAGPAGAATAIHLARRGFCVCLLDRARFPREKPCGEFLSPAGTPLLEELGVREAVEAAGARRLARVRIVVPGERPLDLTIPGPSGDKWGYSLSRRRLDAILVDAARRAGAEVREGMRVVEVVHAAGRVAGVTARPEEGGTEEVRARLVVGAGGRNCPVARALGLQRRQRRRRYDLLAHWGPAPVAGAGRGREDEIEPVCELVVGADEYVAAAPIENGRRNVNCVVPQEALRRTPEAGIVYRRTVGRLLAGSSWTEGSPDEDVVASDVTPLRTRRATADGAFLVGDSALFLDPFTGQGLYLALRSAALAAPVAAAALKAGRTGREQLAEYDRRRDVEFGNKLRVSRAIQTILYRPRLARRVVGALRRDAALSVTLAEVTGDLVPAHRVWSPGFGLRLARAAIGRR
ncbi:MAG TPA: FAD-dependent oxidoreductase [Gemmatimonadota bacterium]|nr:FAD-dependent oxidoreductase [Gemmatimonadota bacterium]